LVGVVVPTHLPDPHYLGETLASVVAQEWANWEVIVVDDGSAASNETLEQLVGIDRRIRLLRGPKGGPARARNLGLQHARGELVAFLDSDDYWYPPHLAHAVSAIAHHEEAVACYSALALALTSGSFRAKGRRGQMSPGQ
jgi:glycosyltransferase involved in cell wall biosynthesis